MSTALLSVALLGLALAGSAWGCSCAPPAPGESLREADAAIVARLVKVVPRGELHADYRYEVQQVYRGRQAIESGQMVTVRSGRDSAACALPSRTDHRYGLFLTRAQGRWISGICGVIEPRRLRAAAEQQPRVNRSSGGSDPSCSA